MDGGRRSPEMVPMQSRYALPLMIALFLAPFVVPPATAAGTCSSPAFRANAYPSFSNGFVSPSEPTDWWYFNATLAEIRLTVLEPAGADVDLEVRDSSCTLVCESKRPPGFIDSCLQADAVPHNQLRIGVHYYSSPATGSIKYQLTAEQIV